MTICCIQKVHQALLHARINSAVNEFDIDQGTVNSLIFAGIDVCVFETRPCLWGLIFLQLGQVLLIMSVHMIYVCDFKTIAKFTK